jgi:hypothetical protein
MVDEEDVGERLEGLLAHDAVLHPGGRGVGVVLELEAVPGVKDLRLELDKQALLRRRNNRPRLICGKEL